MSLNETGLQAGTCEARKSDCKIDSENNVSITTTQAQLIKTIKAHIAG